MTRATACVAALVLAATPAWAGQETPAAVDAPAATPAVVPAALPATPNAALCCSIPAGTIVQIEMVQEVSSKTAKIGEMFPIRVREDLAIDGRLMVPAGTPGQGQVVHSAPARMGGKPGELILAVRFLEIGGSRIPIRGLRFSGAGKDNVDLTVAAVAAVGVVGFLISGGNKRVPAGAYGEAKVSADTSIAPGAPAAAAPATEPAVPAPVPAAAAGPVTGTR